MQGSTLWVFKPRQLTGCATPRSRDACCELDCYAREPGATLEKISGPEKQLFLLQAFAGDFMLQREMDSQALPPKTTNLVFLPLPELMRRPYR